jgi:hypothetical protein
VFQILRFYADPDKHTERRQTFATLEEAQEWCQRDDTHEPGVWFDGYTDLDRESS